MPTIKPPDLRVGDTFPAPLVDEGPVKAVCAFGRCDQDNRPDSVHVRSLWTGGEWFIALIDWEDLHVCDADCDGSPEHATLNRNQR